MAWTLSYTATAKQQLKKLDKQVARRIHDYMTDRIAELDDPRSAGKPLIGNLGTLWRYRVGDYRIICDIADAQLIVLVVRIGHRKNIYE